MKTLVSVISYNEEANLEATLRDLLDSDLDVDIVVVDNGSNDRTRAICDRVGVQVVRHCVNTGSSVGALLSYFNYAWATNYQALCQFDGDGQHIAAELPKIIAPLQQGIADCVIGSRFIERVGFQSTPTRRLGIVLFSSLFNSVTGCRLTDISSGFRAYGQAAIEFFGHRYRDPFYDSVTQFLLVAHFAGLRIVEVPVQMRPRLFGQSEFTPWNSMTFPVKSLMTFAACVLQRDRVVSLRGT